MAMSMLTVMGIGRKTLVNVVKLTPLAAAMLDLRPLASTLPFDDNRAVVRNERGRVEPGLYCAGWVKRGPTGIIGTNIPDARETVEAIIGDAEAGALSLGGEYGESPLVHLAKDETRVVTWDDFRRIDQSECAAGAAQGKPREKIVDVHEMLRVAKAT